MTRSIDRQRGLHARLAPHQSVWMARILAARSGSRIRIVAPAGAGVVSTVCTAIGHLVVTDPEARLLVVTASASAQQLVARIAELSDAGSVTLITRKLLWEGRVRQREHQTLGLPAAGVHVVTYESIANAEVWSVVALTPWSFVFIDGTLQPGKAERYARQVGEGATNRVVAFVNIPTGSWGGYRDMRLDLADLLSGTQSVWEPINYSHTQAESDLRFVVAGLQSTLSSTSAGLAQRSALSSAAASSFYALEALLDRLQPGLVAVRNQVAHSMDDGQLAGAAVWAEPLASAEIVGSALAMLYDLHTDTKLEALVAFLEQMRSPARFVCVFSEHHATLDYLASALETRGLTPERADAPGPGASQIAGVGVRLVSLAEAESGDLPGFDCGIVYDEGAAESYDAVFARAARVSEVPPLRLVMRETSTTGMHQP